MPWLNKASTSTSSKTSYHVKKLIFVFVCLFVCFFLFFFFTVLFSLCKLYTKCLLLTLYVLIIKEISVYHCKQHMAILQSLARSFAHNKTPLRREKEIGTKLILLLRCFCRFNPFHATCLFYTPWKQKSFGCLMFSGGMERAVAWNGLTISMIPSYTLVS